jgi:ubiquinone/menaquinone biosynthesis C-methylase UbiE
MNIIMNLSVKETYNKIATEFDITRYSVWRQVKAFIDSIPTGSKLLEVGSGNGKNLLYRNDLDCYGIDISIEQVKLCKKKGLNVIEGCMTSLPYPDNFFDNLICIATYHHLNNDDDRKQALMEMLRVIKPNGKILISVWALEQDEMKMAKTNAKFTKEHEMVPWKSKDGSIYYRYYHIYSQDIVNKELNLFIPGISYQVANELNNWFITINKP